MLTRSAPIWVAVPTLWPPRSAAAEWSEVCTKGFRDLMEIGLTNRVPRIVAGQPLDYFAGIDQVTIPDCKGARPLDANWANAAIRKFGRTVFTV